MLDEQILGAGDTGVSQPAIALIDDRPQVPWACWGFHGNRRGRCLALFGH
ncbi:hypothetical protein [Streptomyces collinus]|nr:hypothetical protein [Streptomyces collinus]